MSKECVEIAQKTGVLLTHMITVMHANLFIQNDVKKTGWGKPHFSQVFA
jgi:hypothetical protein